MAFKLKGKSDGMDNGNFKQKYITGQLLGKGAFSEVYRVTSKQDGKEYAAKVIRKSGMGKGANVPETMEKEIKIMRTLKHKHIVCIQDYMETKKEMYIVMDLADGGELFDRIVERGSYTEKDAANIMRQILEALDYLHTDRKVVHRDIKPENILFKTKHEDSDVMISDFGLSKISTFSAQDNMKTACGTPGYCAPEILSSKSYSEKVDCWSIGVVCYILLCGYPPFSFNDNDQALFRQIRKGKYEFDSPAWDPISDSAKDFVSKLLHTHASIRMSAKEAWKHPWIQGMAKTENIADMVGKNLKKNRGKMRWHQIATVINFIGASRNQALDDHDEPSTSR
jgi:calcium/calmodulin-dependent protein kinase I